ncbi:PEGA domain-containing protein [Candidatus Uhrbacteria bacterium]|nr:PEGA domain-containing protein [Candidatus Uhrbacteria bacterium]
MSKTLRLILFLAFLLAFLISAPLVVLYTAGYRLDLGRGKIVHTAVLNITSIPRSANITIDGEMLSERTPSVIETITPGEHEIRLDKSGYLPWSQRVTFVSREATFATDVVLFLDGSPSVVEDVEMMDSSVSPDGSHLAYLTQTSSWLEVWTTSGQTDSTKLSIRVPYSALKQYSLSWSLTGRYLSLVTSNGRTKEVSIVRVQDGSSIVLPQTILKAQDVWWDASSDDELYVSSNTVVQRISVAQGSTQKLSYMATRVQSFGGRDLFLTVSNSATVLSFEENATASILTYLPLGSYEFVRGPAGLVSLYEHSRHRLILLDPNNREQPIVLNEEVAQWSWDTPGNQLLYTSGYDLKRYDRSANTTETLTRLSEPMDRLGWYPRGTVAVFQSSGVTTAMRLEDPEEPTQEILAQEISGPFWLSDDGNTLYLVNETDAEDTIWMRTLQD